MNKKQRCVLFVCAAVIVLMLLYPPFLSHGRNGMVANMGYAFLFHAPYGDFGDLPSVVNVGMLLAQWVGVILVGGILWFAFRDKRVDLNSPGSDFQLPGVTKILRIR